MRKVLSDVLLKTTKPPKSGRLEIADDRCSGLSFRVTSTDRRSWSFRFRDPRSSKPARCGLGSYPDVSLADARARASELRKVVASGKNPLVEKRRTVAESSQRTVSALVTRYLSEHAKRHKRSWAGDDRNLRLHVLPFWKDREFAEIRRADVVELIERMITAGTHTNANRVQSLISKVFNFAIDIGVLENNPCHRMKKRGVEKPATRVLNDNEIQLLWNRCVQNPVSKYVGLCLRLAILTGCRASEITGMKRAELVDLTNDNARWIIPAERVKNKRDHLVPLLPLTKSLIIEALGLSSSDTYVFPSPTKNDAPIEGHALTVAMIRLTADFKAKDVAEGWVTDPPSPHDLRRTFGTRLASLGVHVEDRAAVLNHKPTTITQIHYDVYDRLKEKRAALLLWEESLQAMLKPEISDISEAA
jgi:integrase